MALLLGAGAAITFVLAGMGGSASKGVRQIAGRRGTLARSEPPKPVLLPRGGRTLLPGHLIVSYYGIIGTSNVLGQTLDPQADAAGVERAARVFGAFGRPVRPAFELVTTIASPDPGPDGTYSSPIPTATLHRYVAAARRHKLLLILDFQPGRGDFLPEVRRYEHLLLDPGVGVALDPEWKLTPSQVPDQVIGMASAASINAVSAYLSRLVIVHHLPQKLFVVHQFRLSELPDRQAIRTRPGLATILQMDGLGAVAVKLDSYRQVMTGARAFYPGFKVFLRPSDDPVKMTPAQVMALRPRPDYVSFQWREEAAGTHRAEAEGRERQAEQAERRARIAEQEAQRDRAEARVKQEQAAMHEKGMADDQLIGDHERQDFAGTSAVPEDDAGASGDGQMQPTSAYEEGRRAAHGPERGPDFEEGRQRER